MAEQLPEAYTPRFNIAPGQMIAAVIAHNGRNRIGRLQWGLIPSWAKDAKIGSSLINARAETLMDKPSFRKALLHKRCLIPADGFYEWKKTPKGKQPLRFTLKSKEIFAMAGIYDSWMSPDGHRVNSCSIITTAPNRLVEDVHDRMPVILRPEYEALWLDRGLSQAGELLPLLVSYDPDAMTAYPVHAMVGNVKNDVSTCIEEWEDEELTLF